MVKVKPNWLALVCFIGASFALQGFVLEGSKRMDVDVSRPDVTFYLSQSVPALKDKDQFEDGAYKDLPDDEFWLQMVRTVMQKWNEVEGSYINLVLADERVASYDSADLRNSIVAVSGLPVSVAADAHPIAKNNLIIDCDMRVRNQTQSAPSLANTLLHELGHCLGIGHNHIDTKSIMSYNRSRTKLVLGLQDLAALIYLYPDPQYETSRQDFAPCGVVASGSSSSQRALWLAFLIIPALIVLVFHKFTTRGLRK